MIDLAQSLEKPSEEFYKRLSGSEEARVKHVVGVLVEYLISLRRKVLIRESFLIAGVGGILRRDDPVGARDIDLVVAGLKYTIVADLDAAREPDTPIDRIYPYVIYNFLERLAFSEGGDIEKMIDFYPSIGDSSFPCVLFNEHIFMKDRRDPTSFKSVVEPELDSLSHFRGLPALGVSASYDGCRNIDVMFTLGSNIREWRENQQTSDADLVDGKSRHYFYSILRQGD